MARKRKTRAQWIDERLAELGMTQAELAERAGIRSRETLRRIRRGEGAHARTIRNIEANLGWAIGGIADIDEGKAPRVVDVEAVAARPLPAAVVGQAPHFRAPGAPATEDYPAQLRILRQRMGADAFWQEIEAMDDEKATKRDRPHVTS